MAPRTAKAKKEVNLEVLDGNKKTLQNDSKKEQNILDEDIEVTKIGDNDNQRANASELKKGKEEISLKGRVKKLNQNDLRPVEKETTETKQNKKLDAELQLQKAHEKISKKGRGLKSAKDLEKISKNVVKSKLENGNSKVIKDVTDQKENSVIPLVPLVRERRGQKKTVLINPIPENVMDIDDNELQIGRARKAQKKTLSKSRDKKPAKITNSVLIRSEHIHATNIVPGDSKNSSQKNEEITSKETTIPVNKSNIPDEHTQEKGKNISKGRGKKAKGPGKPNHLPMQEKSQDVNINTTEKQKSENRVRRVRKPEVPKELIHTENASNLSDNEKRAPEIKSHKEKKQEMKPHKQKKYAEIKTNIQDCGSRESLENIEPQTNNEEIISHSQPKQATGNKRTAPKRTKGNQSDDKESHNAEEPPSKKSKAEAKKPALKNKSDTVYEDIDLSNSSTNAQGQPWNLKICSWNVDGIRAWLKKGGLNYIEHEKPDILCLQEVKCSQDKLPAEVANIPGYHRYWLSSEDNEGYAGVGIYTTKMAIHVQYGLQDEEFDSEGRIITAEYEQFYLICTYVPNAGRKLVTLPKRLKWNEIFQQYVKNLDEKKPVIICGDMNVAHNEIDLANPKSNKKNAGFTAEEREGMTSLLSCGFVDTFRHLYPEQIGAYTFWTYMSNARSKNVGWRLDYLLVSERLLPTVCDNVIRSQVFGSDHCPIALFLHLTSVPKIPPE